MRYPKLNALVLALAFGAAASVGAQTIIYAAPPEDSQTVVVMPPSAVVVEPTPSVAAPIVVMPAAPNPVPDPAADAKCRFIAPGNYWDCVNNHAAGQ